MSTADAPATSSLLASLLSDDAFRPDEPRSIAETGLSETIIETLIYKYVNLVGSCSGREIAEKICIPFGLLEDVFSNLRRRQILAHTGSAPLNDYFYTLTDNGRDRARTAMAACSYVGPAPVPLEDYLVSVEAQTGRNCTANCPG